MSDEPISKALQENFNWLVKCHERRIRAAEALDRVDQEIAKVTPKVIGLARLLDTPPPENSPLGHFLIETAATGITGALRAVLMGSAEPMTPLGIRDELVRMGVSLTDYQNPLAVIGSTLLRMEKSGEVKKESTPEGRPFYTWNRDSVEVSTPQMSLGQILAKMKEPTPTRGPAAFKHSPLKHIGRRQKEQPDWFKRLIEVGGILPIVPEEPK